MKRTRKIVAKWLAIIVMMAVICCMSSVIGLAANEPNGNVTYIHGVRGTRCYGGIESTAIENYMQIKMLVTYTGQTIVDTVGTSQLNTNHLDYYYTPTYRQGQHYCTYTVNGKQRACGGWWSFSF